MPPAAAHAAKYARSTCHVLVLGAGLAGMRAAWAAKEAAPGLDVTLVCPRKGPSGSSFTNRNNALGIQAPLPHEAETFVAEVLRLAPPGHIRPELVRALAADAPARVAELHGLGLSFRTAEDGSPARFPGCFSPHPRAQVFDGLAAAHAAFLAKLSQLGVRLLHGHEALQLLADADGRVCGARLYALRGGQTLTLRAGAVIAALGGPAPLFARRICGGGSGLAYGLLHSAGARLVNTRHLQFFWGTVPDGSFVNPGALPWPEELAALAAARRTHCPVACSLPDAALDRALLCRREANKGMRGTRGLVRLPLPNDNAQAAEPPLALFAHAGNGGALVDERGGTSVPGLFACGECAGGMHGAQRLGGGMVLSALVFGARAGAAATKEATGGEASRREAARAAAGLEVCVPAATDAPPPGPAADDAAFLRRLRRGMDRHALPFCEAQAGRRYFVDWLRRAASQGAALRQRLLALSALLVLGEAD
ncbi:FAD-binding protein [Humidesulfovibrio sp.]